ncbi:uncharacterized protein LOC117641335 isoform X2 [Thrips palmi]|nr:uncharacterized protein LOC117641335 isoform X2 [Thrips palmi]XP_034234457.1 uncharacterized protein LOC117641335 isoform X2 [Thrips palmi]
MSHQGQRLRHGLSAIITTILQARSSFQRKLAVYLFIATNIQTPAVKSYSVEQGGVIKVTCGSNARTAVSESQFQERRVSSGLHLLLDNASSPSRTRTSPGRAAFSSMRCRAAAPPDSSAYLPDQGVIEVNGLTDLKC